VHGWDAVHTVLTSRRVSSGPYLERLELSRRFGPSMIGADQEQHRRLRAAAEPMFSREAVAALEPHVLVPAVDDSLEAIAPLGGADLVATLCTDLPVRVLAGMLGVDREVVDALVPLAEVVTADDLEEAALVADACFDGLRPQLSALRRVPTARDRGLLHTIVAPAGLQLSDTEAFALVRLLVIAGIDTLGRSAASLLLAMLSHPTDVEAMQSHPATAEAAVDESIRWECPAVSVPRLVVQDLEVAGVTLPAGSLLHCYLASANHDPTRWEHPADFDPHRERRAHAGFGLGPHRCLGMHLARATLAILARRLPDRLPGMRLAPDRTTPRVEGDHVRGPERLEVVWQR
jgi:cytochrome P450